ncbi:MAG: YciI family protein [Alphaproteobacteria bacterium]
MRVMVLVKATKDSEAGTMPSRELLEAMGKYNQELTRAGVMLAGEGLKPSSEGVRVAFAWARRCSNPMPGPSELEIRPLFEAADFGDALPPERIERQHRDQTRDSGI